MLLTEVIEEIRKKNLDYMNSLPEGHTGSMVEFRLGRIYAMAEECMKKILVKIEDKNVEEFLDDIKSVDENIGTDFMMTINKILERRK